MSDSTLLAKLEEAEQLSGALSNSLCNIADTCRSRGFPAGVNRGVDQRVIDMTQSLENKLAELEAENARLKERIDGLSQFLRIVHDSAEQDNLVEWVKDYAAALNQIGNAIFPGSKELERKLLESEADRARLNSTIDSILKDPEYKGGIQQWMKACTNMTQKAVDACERVCQLEQSLFESEAKCERMRLVLEAALDYKLASRGTPGEFYCCYTYENGQLPPWINVAKALVGETAGATLRAHDLELAERAYVEGHKQSSASCLGPRASWLRSETLKSLQP